MLNLRLKVREEYESGLVAMWLNNEATKGGEEEDDEEIEYETEEDDGKLVIESHSDSFEAYVAGFYSNSHYSISIQEKIL